MACVAQFLQTAKIDNNPERVVVAKNSFWQQQHKPPFAYAKTPKFCMAKKKLFKRIAKTLIVLYNKTVKNLCWEILP